MTDAVEAAREVLSAIEAMKGKQLAVRFQDEQTAQWVSSCITNAGNVARAYLASVERERKLRDALQDVISLSITRDNYGPGAPTRDELRGRLTEAELIARAVLSTEPT